MVEIFWYYVVTMVFVSANIGLLLVYRYFLGNKYTEAANKLKSQMANIRRDYPTIGAKPGEVVGEGIEGLGIDGIIDSLGLPKFVTPFIKGFVSNPDNIKKILEILKSKGINFQAADKNEEGLPLL